jgi:hypothetical protein
LPQFRNADQWKLIQVHRWRFYQISGLSIISPTLVSTLPGEKELAPEWPAELEHEKDRRRNREGAEEPP